MMEPKRKSHLIFWLNDGYIDELAQGHPIQAFYDDGYEHITLLLKKREIPRKCHLNDTGDPRTSYAIDCAHDRPCSECECYY